MKYIEMFAGIGCSTVAWHKLGWKPLAFAEIEPFPSAVLAHHYPGVPNLGDVSKVDWAPYRGVDVVVGGFPCQDLSIAGKRAGLQGHRSGLFWELLRCVRETHPAWVVVENVPGLLSSRAGSDAFAVLDALEGAGYVVDLDILDAQYFGVPQRRRRVFIICQSVENILSKRTNSSGLTIAQCVCEISQSVLAVARGQFPTGCKRSECDASRSLRSLQRRMQLFGLDSEGQASRWLQHLAGPQLLSGREQSGLALENGSAQLRNSEGIKSPRSEKGRMVVTEEFPSTDLSWRRTWADLLATASECITSTGLSEITESKIFSCALLTLFTLRRITRSPLSCPSFLAAASSALTSIEVFINYARQASRPLLEGVGGIQPWDTFAGQACRDVEALRGLRDRAYREQVLPFEQGLRRNSAARGEAGQAVTHSVAQCLGASGRGVSRGGESRGQDPVVAVAFGGNSTRGAIDVATACRAKGGTGHGDFESETFVTHALRADGFDVSEDGTGRGTPLVPAIAFYPTGGTHGVSAIEDCSPAVKVGSGLGIPSAPAVAYPIQEVGKRTGASTDDPLSALQKVRRPLLDQGQSAHSCYGVRRLTPKEAERLMGLPDGYTDVPFRGKRAADGPRYKACGNGMVTNCMEWIGRRIQEYVDKQKEQAA